VPVGDGKVLSVLCTYDYVVSFPASLGLGRLTQRLRRLGAKGRSEKVRDKVTGELLEDTDVVCDRRAE
jgi:hypothetical protein